MQQTDDLVNPLLAPIQMPGETFTLPSNGLLYPEGVLHPSCRNGEVRVHPMTALDDIAIKSPDMLFSGDAVRQVFGRCIPQVLDVNQLFARDVDFLLLCLRKVSYGPEMTILHTHDCDHKEHSYVLDTDGFIKRSKQIDPTRVEQAYTCKLDNGQTVKLHPIHFVDFVAMMQATDIDASDHEAMKSSILGTLASIILSVDDVSDTKMIAEWLDAVPPKYLKILNDGIQKTVEWGPDFTTEITCRGCQEKVEVTAPLNPLLFFT